jgi:hypothetical protein
MLYKLQYADGAPPQLMIGRDEDATTQPISDFAQ